MPEVRFGKLAHGQHFVWRNREWTKIGPLLAQRKGRGDTVMLRRSTLVEVRESQMSIPGLERRMVSREELGHLFREIALLAEKLPLRDPEREVFVAEVREHFLAVMHTPQTKESA